MVSRRDLLAVLSAAPRITGVQQSLPPVRPLTFGPKFHWFGYYDKLQFDPTGRYVLAMQTGFEHRSPKADDVIQVGMIDLASESRWIELGESRAWNWQQGCMLQWIPGSDREVIWNDRAADRFVAHVLDVRTRRRRTLPAPVYALSPDGRWAVAPDFRRLNDTRPGYGYAGLPDPNRDVLAPEDSGIWRMDLSTGRRKLILSVAGALQIPCTQGDWSGAKHWFNHLLVSPDGRRFIFLHRWRGKREGAGFSTRMFTANPEGGDLHVLDPYGKTSHFIWRDATHVLAWAWRPPLGEKFYLFEDRTDRAEPVGPGTMTVNGHCSYLPGNRWILNDTYPDKDRNQHLYIFDTRSGERRWLGHFYSPPPYTGEWRCDLHPRFSPDGRWVTIDSPHAGNGRQVYLIRVPY